MSDVEPEAETPTTSWPSDMPAPYGYLVARAGAPEPYGLIADIVMDGAGVYLAATTEHLAARVRLARAVIPYLPIVPTGVVMRHGLIDGSLWEALLARAHAAMPNEMLLAVVAREPREGEIFIAATAPYTLVEPRLDESGTGAWQAQQAPGCNVRATPVTDAVVEVHSHNAMSAYFSPTDDHDETGRRIFGVIGRLDTDAPELAFRVATGCSPHVFEPVPFEQVFVTHLAILQEDGPRIVEFVRTDTRNADAPATSRCYM